MCGGIEGERRRRLEVVVIILLPKNFKVAGPSSTPNPRSRKWLLHDVLTTSPENMELR
jgi:hypothetical protein